MQYFSPNLPVLSIFFHSPEAVIWGILLHFCASDDEEVLMLLLVTQTNRFNRVIHSAV